jgi:serine/threonine protein kinase/tetratricopeptide (TPR) repeat protein
MTHDTTPERWLQLKGVVQQALDTPPAERAALLERVCGSDLALRREAETLLAAAGTLGDFLDASPVVHLAELAAAHDAPPLTERLSTALAGRYVIEREIGRGGMATVFLARDLRHDRPVALKVLSPELAAVMGPGRFLSEIRVTANLQHPHLLPLFDSGEADGLLYYTMPYVDGESLRARLAREHQLPIDDAVRIVVAIAGALDYAHRRGVVHRDLKPENILLPDGQPVVADFGIALAVAKAGGTRLTGTGVSLGTPHYMSPEQATGDRQVDGRSDVYSLGCVLYEMLTGEVPHPGSSMQAVIARVLTDVPTDVRVLRSRVPEHLAAAVMTALEKLPADRWQSARAFADALVVNPGTQSEQPDSARIANAPSPDSLTTAPDVSQSAAASRRRRDFGKHAVRVAIVTGLIGLAAALGIVISRRVSSPQLSDKRVVVVPFDNQTGDTALAPLGRLAAEWTTQGLSQAGSLEVVDSRTAEAALEKSRGTPRGTERIRGIAATTRARTVVSGAYYLDGDTLHFHAEITDAGQGRLMRALDPTSAPASSPRQAIVVLRQHILGAVATLLDTAVNPWTREQPPSLEAYRRWTDGLELFRRGEFDASVSHFLAAARLDSTYYTPILWAAAARGNLGQLASADSLLQRVTPLRDQLSFADRLLLDYWVAGVRGNNGAALEAARAMARSRPGVVLVHGNAALIANRPREAIAAYTSPDVDVATIGRVPTFWNHFGLAYHLSGEYRRELQVVRRGRKQHPEELLLLKSEVRSLAALGRAGEVTRLLDEVRRLPASSYVTPGQFMEGAAKELLVHGQVELASAASARALAWWSEQPAADSTLASRLALASANYTAARYDRARDIVTALARVYPAHPDVLGYSGVLAARRGDREAALTADSTLAALRDPYLAGVNTLWRSRIAALLGEQERAITLLRQAFAEGETYMDVHDDPDFLSLHENSAFRDLVRPQG